MRYVVKEGQEDGGGGGEEKRSVVRTFSHESRWEVVAGMPSFNSISLIPGWVSTRQ